MQEDQWILDTILNQGKGRPLGSAGFQESASKTGLAPVKILVCIQQEPHPSHEQKTILIKIIKKFESSRKGPLHETGRGQWMRAGP